MNQENWTQETVNAGSSHLQATKKLKSRTLKMLIASVLALIVTSAIVFYSQTVAYFTDGSDINPIVTIQGANLSGMLVEITIPMPGAEPVLGPTDLKILPGTTVEKSIAVKNTGDLGMYVRVKVDKNIVLSPENEGQPVDPSLIRFEIDSEHWEQRDGFYYYKTPLLHGEVTAPLFTEIEFSSQMNNTYINSTISFHAKAYATQVPGNGVSVFEAQGWPAVQ